MLRALSATCRVVHGLFGAVAAVRQDDSAPKDALTVFRLLCSVHTEGLTIAQAVDIAFKARVHRLDPFDLWMVFDGYHCDNLDHAVTQALDMQAFYRRRPTVVN